MYVIRSNYSDNSIALIQWAYENELEGVQVCYVDTGWAGEGWLNHVVRCEEFVSRNGFHPVRLQSRVAFADLMAMKNGFPNQRYQWCSLHLKGITFLQWIDEIDPQSQAVIMIARRGAGHGDVPKTIESCEYHGERKVWHPFHSLGDEQREGLLERAGIQSLGHRSLECDPCINSSIADLRRLAESDIAKTEELEEDIEATMFDPQMCAGAHGIRKVIQWAQSADHDALQLKYGCSASFGCGV